MNRLIRAFIIAAVCLIAQAAVCFAETEYKIDAVYNESACAVTVNMTVEYTNETGEYLDGVMFNVYPGCLRRADTLPYDNTLLEAAFPSGYAPSGIEFTYVGFNGAKAGYAFQGTSEVFMRVACELKPGETGTFAFSYTLLLSENRAFQGCSNEVRLKLFYPCACVYDEGFVLGSPSKAVQEVFCEPSEFTLRLSVPTGFVIAPAGEKLSSAGGYDTYLLEYESVSEIAVCFSRRYYIFKSDSLPLRVLGSSKSACRKALSSLEEAARVYSGYFGYLPRTDVVLGDTVLSSAAPGLLIAGDDVTDETDLFALLAKAYFNCAVITDYRTDPFLRDGLAEYCALLATEEISGTDAFTSSLNDRLLPALKITIPGSLTPDTHLSHYTCYSDYENVCVKRGAAVLHELRLTMGREAFIKAIARYENNNRNKLCQIRDFVSALGEEYGPALIAWLYTIDDYSLSPYSGYD